MFLGDNRVYQRKLKTPSERMRPFFLAPMDLACDYLSVPLPYNRAVHG